MASGDQNYESLIKKIMAGYENKTYDSTYGVGFPAWNHVHDGILMGEYYLLTKDKALLPPMKSLATCLNDSVWPQTGGLSHRPFAAIQRRMAAGGPKGYGAMAMPGGLGMLALSLFKQAELPHAQPAYTRFHQAFLSSVSPSGAIGYGFTSWDHAVIEQGDPKASPRNSPQGIGFECLDGMVGIGDYKLTRPTKADPRYRPTDRLDKEQATNRVFDRGGSSRLVVRTMVPNEPSKPYKQNGKSCDHFGRSGVGALAHAIGNDGNQSWAHLSDLMATGCAKSYKGLLDGHASTHMHVLWGSLGASLAPLSDAGQLQPLPMSLSKTKAKVKLIEADASGELTFQALTNEKQATFAFADLNTIDHALLSRLDARLRPDDQAALARAGLYMEAQGQQEIAKQYYEKTGEEAKAQAEKALAPADCPPVPVDRLKTASDQPEPRDGARTSRPTRRHRRGRAR
ncbi:MAG: hypothetical protein ACI8XO_004548 [Verrucomicrobiales bacterium]|jgi:hypothetical protein